MIKLSELRREYLDGRIEKKLYWQIARESYMRILPEIQEVLSQNDEVDSVTITRGGVVLKKHDGVLNYFDFTQSICRAEVDILLEGDPEKEDMNFIRSYLKDKGQCNVLDIGANVGIFSLNLYMGNTEAIFHLFEPIPTTYKLLKKNAALNNVNDERYRPYNVGMSDKKGSFKFYVPASCEAASLVMNDDTFYRKKADEFGNYTGSEEIDTVECKVDTVDEFVTENGIDSIRFIKIDVEGNEKFVLEGAKETLKKHKPLVYCELLRKHAKRFGYHPNDVINYMKELGYGCFILVEKNMRSVDSVTEETVETNFFFSVEY